MSIQSDESAYFGMRTDLVRRYLGMWVAVKDGRVSGVYSSYKAAVDDSALKYGAELPYIHRVQDPEPVEVV